jgi:hypothetical protein
MNRLSALSIRGQLRRPRTRVAAIGCMLTLAGAVAIHHSPMPGQGMDMPGMGMIVCLAVIGVAVGVTAALSSLQRVRFLPFISRLSDLEPANPASAPAARAGPPLFLRLATLRR